MRLGEKEVTPNGATVFSLLGGERRNFAHRWEPPKTRNHEHIHCQQSKGRRTGPQHERHRSRPGNHASNERADRCHRHRGAPEDAIVTPTADETFLLSDLSEDELIQQITANYRFLFVASAFALLLGIGLLVAAVLL